MRGRRGQIPSRIGIEPLAASAAAKMVIVAVVPAAVLGGLGLDPHAANRIADAVRGETGIAMLGYWAQEVLGCRHQCRAGSTSL